MFCSGASIEWSLHVAEIAAETSSAVLSEQTTAASSIYDEQIRQNKVTMSSFITIFKLLRKYSAFFKIPANFSVSSLPDKKLHNLYYVNQDVLKC